MGRKADIPQELQLLRDTIREAHEAVQALRQAIKDASALAPALTAQFQAYHKREMQRLANNIQHANNEAAAQLNAEVSKARQHVMRQLSISRLKYDSDSGTLRVTWNADKFDDQIPAPFPAITAQEDQP